MSLPLELLACSNELAAFQRMPGSKRIVAEETSGEAMSARLGGLDASGTPKKKLTGKEKKLKRKEEVAKAKVREDAVRQAYSRGSILADFPAFRSFQRNGLSIALDEKKAEDLSGPQKHFIEDLLESNMKGVYGDSWPDQAASRKKEMTEQDALYFLLQENTSPSEPQNEGPSTSIPAEGLAGFVHFRFVIEEDVPVLYLYELQLVNRVRRHGLGKFLMQLLELIARKNNMKGVMLTIQKRNKAASEFYLNRMKYVIDSISPSKSHPLAQPGDYDYEILSKIHDPEARQHLESRCKLAQAAWLSEGY